MLKKTIHFSDEDLKEQAELIDLLGLANLYGALPKTIKLSITLSKNYIKYLAQVIPTLKPSELDILLSSIKKIKLRQYARKVRILQEKAAKK